MGSLWEAEGLGSPQLLLCAGDLVIDPAHRRHGLFALIHEAAQDDLVSATIPYLLSLSASPTVRLLSLQSGWQSAGQFLQLRRPGKRKPERPWQPFRILDQELAGGDGPVEGISITRTPRPEAMADLVARIGHDGRIRQVRSAAYLQWRFNNPRSSYRFCYLDRGGLRAYLVLQTRSLAEPDMVRILDWEGAVPDDRRAVLKAALGPIEDRVEIRRSSLPDSDQASLAQAGFMAIVSRSVTGPHTSLLVAPMPAAGGAGPWLLGRREVLDLSSWDHRALYSDGG
jgi:hypothetical protein